MLQVNKWDIRIVAFLLLPSLIMASDYVMGQRDENQHVTYVDIIHKSFDIAFPYNKGNPGSTYFSMMLRYIPASMPASQLVIRYGVNSQVSIDYMICSVPFEKLYST